MSEYEKFVCGHFLSKHPAESFNKILELIEGESSLILVWEPFEKFDTENIVRWMEDMLFTLETDFTPIRG